MGRFLALITNRKYWILHSLIIRCIMRCYGIKVGKRFYIEGTPYLKVRGKGSDIQIGDNVSIYGPIDLRNREQGKIIIGNGVHIDENCRFVAANQATLKIGDRSNIGCRTIINCGVDVLIGEDFLSAGDCVIQSSEHGFKKGERVVQQKHTYGEILIGNDVWMAAQSVIAKGAQLGDGCIVGAKALVRKGKYTDNSILVGVPAKSVKERI